MPPVIEFENVSKQYMMGSGTRSLRAALASVPLRLMGHPVPAPPKLWALKDVSFQVEAGQSLGIVGHNGAGKTTALKLLSQVTYPTQGSIRVRGRLGTLIELGAGFHPEMTGRENVYLNGVILGMTRREIAARFDSIVDFAGIDDFIDTPVKRYSSGMYVRLAFAVAAHIDPDVLLVDEVLAVGDISFRAKCYRRMADLRQNGTTVVLVSHDVYAIRDTCDRAILLWQGQILDAGEPDSVITTYLHRMQALGTEPMAHASETQGNVAFAVPESTKAKITGVTLSDEMDHVIQTVESGKSINIDVCYSAQERVRQPIFRVDFYRGGSAYTGYSTAYDQVVLSPILGDGIMRLHIKGLYVPSGVYSLSVVMAEKYEYNLLDVHHQAYPLQVLRARDSRGEVDLPHAWSYQRPSQSFED